MPVIQPSGTKYFEIRPDDEKYPLQWFLDEPLTVDDFEIDARAFVRGRPYVGTRPARVPVGNPGTELAFSFGAFDMPVVLSEVADTVRRIANDDVECFPVQIPGSTKSYVVLNAVVSLDCLDESRSELTRWTSADHRPDRLGEIHMISKIRIDPVRAEGHQVFRIKGWPIALLVTEKIKNALESFPNLGVTFRAAS